MLDLIVEIAGRDYDTVNYADIADWIRRSRSLMNECYGTEIDWDWDEIYMQEDGILALYRNNAEEPEFVKPRWIA